MDALGWALLVLSLACFCLSVMMTIYGHFLRASSKSRGDAGEGPRLTMVETAVEGAELRVLDAAELTEDERRLYDLIEAAGGEILQMNLVSSGGFSKSKVTRLLDKLERRGLIKRERHGMTNKVKLAEER